jgi:hypothetical protein
LFRRRFDVGPLAWLLVFPVFLVVVLAANQVYSERAALVLLPAVVLAGASGLDEIVRRASSGLERFGRKTVAVTAIAAVIGLGAVFAGNLRVYGERGPAWLGTAGLTDLDRELEGEAVATELPYFVIAHTASPAVTLPLDGEAAIDAVLTRYEIRWLLLFGTDFASPDTPTEALVSEILAGRRSRVGRYRLRHVRTQSGEWSLYRLEGEP